MLRVSCLLGVLAFCACGFDTRDESGVLLQATASELSHIKLDQSGKMEASANVKKSMLRKLHATMMSVSCLAQTNAEGFRALSALAGTVADTFEQLDATIANMASLPFFSDPDDAQTSFAASSAAHWQEVSANLTREANLLEEMSETTVTEEQRDYLISFLDGIKADAEAEEQLFNETFRECLQYQVVNYTGVCVVFGDWSHELQEHSLGATNDAALLQQLYQQVSGSLDLAFIQASTVRTMQHHEISTSDISALQNLADHQLSVLDAVHQEMGRFESLVNQTLSAAWFIPGASLDAANEQAALLSHSAQTTCP